MRVFNLNQTLYKMNTSTVNIVAKKTRPQNKAPINKQAPVPAFSNSNLFFKNEAAEWVATHPFIQTLFLSGAEKITAELAKHILANFNTKNRRINPGKVRKFLRAMKNGQWRITNQGIAFDEKGNLIDGQHRFEALVAYGEWQNTDDLSQTSLEMLVVRGLPAETQHVIDKGTNRSLKDTATMAGHIGGNDREGKKALALVQAHCAKTKTGNGRSDDLATHEDVLDKFLSNLGDSGETFEDFARRLVSYQDNSMHAIHLGHMAAFLDFALYNIEEAERLISLVTANQITLDLLAELNEDTDELSAVNLFRDLLKQEASIKQKIRISHGGGAFAVHYARALFVIQNYMQGKRVKNMGLRTLRTNKEIKKGKKSKFNFNWDMLEQYKK